MTTAKRYQIVRLVVVTKEAGDLSHYYDEFLGMKLVHKNATELVQRFEHPRSRFRTGTLAPRNFARLQRYCSNGVCHCCRETNELVGLRRHTKVVLRTV